MTSVPSPFHRLFLETSNFTTTTAKPGYACVEMRSEYELDGTGRGGDMDVDMAGEGVPTMAEHVANWPRSGPSMASSVPVTMGPGQEQQGQSQRQESGQSRDYGGNAFVLPGYNFGRPGDPGTTLHPMPQSGSRSATISTRSANQEQEPSTIPPSSRSPVATRPAPPPQYSTPAPKVAIPRTNTVDNASHRRRRSARACEPCRQRKVKCDGIRPVCRLCAETNITCQYLDVKRVREQKQLGALTRKVQRYEVLLRELEPESDAALARKIRRALKVCFLTFPHGPFCSSNPDLDGRTGRRRIS